MKKYIALWLLVLGMSLSTLTGCTETTGDNNTQSSSIESTLPSTWKESFSLADVPEYTGDAYIAVHDNMPYFTQEDVTTQSFEDYTPLDQLGRCVEAYANVGQDLMPTEKRGNISSVKPSGWQAAKYDFVDGKYLYNRCHLIGYQLTAENANKENLITGTRYLNIEGMLPFENMIADYVKETGNHVLYRVTPIFDGNNLVANGVLMEGYSVEDEGEGVCFCVYAYNVQPGVSIDYATGNNQEAKNATTQKENTKTENTTQAEETTYILNTDSQKFHKPDCSGAQKISANNRKEFTGQRQELIDMGYTPCGTCKP